MMDLLLPKGAVCAVLSLYDGFSRKTGSCEQQHIHCSTCVASETPVTWSRTFVAPWGVQPWVNNNRDAVCLVLVQRVGNDMTHWTRATALRVHHHHRSRTTFLFVRLLLLQSETCCCHFRDVVNSRKSGIPSVHYLILSASVYIFDEKSLKSRFVVLEPSSSFFSCSIPIIHIIFNDS